MKTFFYKIRPQSRAQKSNVTLSMSQSRDVQSGQWTCKQSKKRIHQNVYVQNSMDSRVTKDEVIHEQKKIKSC